MSPYLHPTAIVEAGVVIGDDTSVWDNVHIRRDARIGKSCIIGEKAHISYEVSIGNFVKINAVVYICTSVTIEEGVMISAGCIFTNDRYPRATDPELTGLRSSAPDEHTISTLVRSGATIGAGCIVGPGVTIGRFAMIGMGSVVTKPVPDFALMAGNPARLIGYVCRCGEPVVNSDSSSYAPGLTVVCASCRREYSLGEGKLLEQPKQTASAAW
jgi:UDP-2-acetamido-3-amino-2,3-dideoxy-glucuronate N-acetyltransferase